MDIQHILIEAVKRALRLRLLQLGSLRGPQRPNKPQHGAVP